VFCVRPFALHRQQPETYKQNFVDSLPLEKFLRTPITRHSRSRIFLQLWTHGCPQGEWTQNRKFLENLKLAGSK